MTLHEFNEINWHRGKMAHQQEDEMNETILEDELKEYQPEGVFARGH